MTQRGGESLTYSVFNKPLTISGHSNTTEFRYGPNHQRFKQVSGSKTTYTLNGGAYEEIVENGTITQKTYIGGFLVHTQSGGNSEMTYLHKDHLGSTDAMTDSLGNLAGQMSFGVWGQRQQSDWQSGTPDSQELDAFATTQGYTGHQQLDDHDLIHMGGRVYDPTLGRFLSADLYVQSPYNSQSFNRYSYTFNNPLSYTDPTGYRSMAGEMVIRGQTISDRQRDAIMASNRQMLFMQQSMQQFVRNMIGQGKSAFTYTMEDGQKYVVHIDAEAFEAGTSGGGAANDSSVGTGNSHSDDSESRNGRGTSLDEEEGMVEFNYKTDGLEKFQEAVEKYDVTNLFKQVLPPGKHVINVSIDPSLGSDVGMHNPDASAILVNPDYLAGRSLAVIGSSVGHELIHVNDRLRGRINSYESESMRASERGAYSWQVSTANHFGLSRPYRTWLRNKISGYR